MSPCIKCYIEHRLYNISSSLFTILMNHKQQGKIVRKIISQVRDREYPYKSREKTRRHDYDLAQCREIGDVINLIRELVDSAVKRLEPWTHIKD